MYYRGCLRQSTTRYVIEVYLRWAVVQSSGTPRRHLVIMPVWVVNDTVDPLGWH
jgi:hypothetical protein